MHNPVQHRDQLLPFVPKHNLPKLLSVNFPAPVLENLFLSECLHDLFVSARPSLINLMRQDVGVDGALFAKSRETVLSRRYSARKAYNFGRDQTRPYGRRELGVYLACWHRREVDLLACGPGFSRGARTP